MKSTIFTIEVIGTFNFKPPAINFKAASIVSAMEGCPIKDIVAALRSMDLANSPGSPPSPARWITQFAGLESKESGKAMEPWIRILNSGQTISDKKVFRGLLDQN